MRSSSGAVATAVAVAAEHGVRCDEPFVLRDAWHVLVHLRPSSVVARVSTDVRLPGGPDPEDLVRELAVAAHAARAGAAVIPPAEELDAGPHRHDGRIVTFWRYIEEQPELDPHAAGRALRTLHDALADYDGPLPAAGHRADVEAMLAALEPSDEVDLLREVSARSPSLEGQALHGDAHLFNCLPSATGPLWHDFECTCRGPREYDLAALVLRDRHSGDAPAREALAAYGTHDADLVDALLPSYGAFVYTSMLIALPRRPDLRPVLGERIRWLRGLGV